MLLNYLSLCWDCFCFFLLLCICQVHIVLIICSLIKCLCIGRELDLNAFRTWFMMLFFCFNYYLLCEHHWNLMPILMAIKEELVGRQPNEENNFLLFIFYSCVISQLCLWLDVFLWFKLVFVPSKSLWGDLGESWFYLAEKQKLLRSQNYFSFLSEEWFWVDSFLVILIDKLCTF